MNRFWCVSDDLEGPASISSRHQTLIRSNTHENFALAYGYLFVLFCYFVRMRLYERCAIWGVCLADGGKFHISVVGVWLLCYYISYYRLMASPLVTSHMKRSQPPDQFSNWLRGIKGKDTHCVSFPVCERAIFHPRRQMERGDARTAAKDIISCVRKSCACFIAFRRNGDVCAFPISLCPRKKHFQACKYYVSNQN